MISDKHAKAASGQVAGSATGHARHGARADEGGAGRRLPAGLVRAFLIGEPLLVLALAPLAWFPSRVSALLLVALPAIWIFRRRALGRFSVVTPYDLPVLGLLCLVPILVAPIVDWKAATPKVLGLLVGLALVYATANAIATRFMLFRAAWLTATLGGGGIAVVGLLTTQWTAKSVVPVGNVYAWLPHVDLEGTLPAGGVHPNEIGGVLALLLPLAVALAVSTVPRALDLARWLRWLGVAGAIGLMTPVLLLTQSRSAYLGTAISTLLVLAWWLVVARRSPRGQLLGGIVLAGIALPVVFVVWQIVGRWIDPSRASLESLGDRLGLWSDALVMLQDFPFTGVGMGQFTFILRQSYAPELFSTTEPVLPHAHNFFLQLGLDLGLFGALAVLNMFLGFFFVTISVYRDTHDRRLRALAVGLGASLLSYLIYGLTDAIVIGARGGIFLWILLGLGAALHACPRTARVRRRSRELVASRA